MGRPPTGGDAVRSGCSWKRQSEPAVATRTLFRRQLSATEQYAEATRVARYDRAWHPTKSAVVMTIENGTKKLYRQIDT